MPDDPPVVLQYNTTKSPWHQRAWLRKATAILFVVISLAVLIAPHGKRIWTHAVLLQTQRQMALFTLPPSQIAYKEAPGATPGMIIVQGQGFQLSTSPLGTAGTMTALQNVELITRYNEMRVELFRMAGVMQQSPVVFLHRRRAAGGSWRIVHVALGSQRSVHASRPQSGAIYPILTAQVFQPASWKQDTWRLGVGDLYDTNLGNIPSGSLILLFGQIDPNDDSHFTIQYQTPTGSGTIDGRLLPDDTVQFTIRDGPAATTRPSDPGADLLEQLP